MQNSPCALSWKLQLIFFLLVLMNCDLCLPSIAIVQTNPKQTKIHITKWKKTPNRKNQNQSYSWMDLSVCLEPNNLLADRDTQNTKWKFWKRMQCPSIFWVYQSICVNCLPFWDLLVFTCSKMELLLFSRIPALFWRPLALFLLGKSVEECWFLKMASTA